MKPITWLAVMSAAAVAAFAAEQGESPLKGTMTSIDGKPVDLAAYKGKVVLVVNVASQCGFTAQYKALQELFKKYEARGFVILGFPCNQFGGQEPGTEADIKEFCATRFGVEFPLFAKIDVNGARAAPLYAYLTSDRAPVADRGPVKWNFEKFLLNREGQVVARFRSRVKPDDAEIVKAVEAALAAVVQ